MTGEEEPGNEVGGRFKNSVHKSVSSTNFTFGFPSLTAILVFVTLFRHGGI